MAKRSKTTSFSPAPKIHKPDQPLPLLSPSRITSTDDHATISGILSTLSPIKPSRYFDGEITDGDGLMRIVGFDKNHLRQLQPYMGYGIPVTLKDCVVQRSRYKNALEIVLKSHTKIEDSKSSFNICDLKTAGSTVVTLDAINGLADNTRITVQAKVTKAHHPEKVEGRNYLKQYVTIADATTTATLILWGKDAGVLQETKSYQLNRLEIRSYMGKKQLSFPSMISFDEIEDLEPIVDDSPPSSDEEETITSVTVSGVRDLEAQYSCNNCSRGDVTETETDVGLCANCGTAQRLILRQSAKVTVRLPDDTRVTLRALDSSLREIAQCDESKEIKLHDLVYAPQFDCTYTKFHVMKQIHRS